VDVSARCPCGTGLAYGECCGPFLGGEALPPTAERLMRSRFTAYAVRDRAYLLHTWHPTTRPSDLILDADTEWFRLDIIGRTAGGLLDSTGTVDFRAYHRTAGVRGEQRENSRFTRVDRRWCYLDAAAGTIATTGTAAGD
jgi:SEC-C motif-containing protein